MKHIIRLFAPILLILVISTNTLLSQVKLPAIFGDNMVLQQQTNVAFWGKAAPGASVRVATSWNGKSYSATADKSGNWKLKAATPGAGGPYNVTISDGKAITLKNVMIGEVWVCSGQSNMEMPMKGFRNQPVIGANCNIIK
jgi:sialate O-acetylesterase